MSTVDDAIATMIANFPARTGRPLDEWVALVRSSGATRHGEIVKPGAGGRLEIGLNLRGVEADGRLEATTGMCTHRVRVAPDDGVDDEILGWLRQAYEGA